MEKKKIKIAILYDKNVWLEYLNQYYDVEISESPDYVLCDSITARECIKKYDCIRIIRIGENLRPDFNLFDYSISFDQIDYDHRNLFYPLFMSYKNDLNLALNKEKDISENEVLDRKFCNYVVSNGNASAPERDYFFDLLSKEYKKIDSGGKYRNNLPNGLPISNKLEFQHEYKFSLAFENSLYKGYTTEKIIQAFAAKTIPIYWGNPDIGNDFNENAFVNCHRYATWSEVIDRIKELDSNPDKYIEALKTPICKKDSLFEKMIEDSYLKNFFDSIFLQPVSEAMKRTNRNAGWGAFYERDAKMLDDMYNNKMIMTLYRLYRKIGRIK